MLIGGDILYPASLCVIYFSFATPRLDQTFSMWSPNVCSRGWWNILQMQGGLRSATRDSPQASCERRTKCADSATCEATDPEIEP